MEKTIKERNHRCRSQTTHAERCAMSMDLASICPDCRTNLGCLYLEWQLPNTLRAGEDFTSTLKVILRESAERPFSIENLEIRCKKTRHMEIEIEEDPDDPMFFDTCFEPMKCLRGKARSELTVSYDFVPQKGVREEIQETYPFFIENIISQSQHITNIAHHQVHVNDKAIYSGGDQRVDFKASETDPNIPTLQTRILLFKKRTRTMEIVSPRKSLSFISPAPFLALRISDKDGCRLILDLRHASQGPFTFGRQLPGKDPARVLFRSYIPANAGYTYFSEPDKDGNPRALSGFSSQQFRVQLDQDGFDFTPLKEADPKRFRILDATFASEEFQVGLFKKDTAIVRLERIKFSMAEFRMSVASKKALRPLNLEFDFNFLKQSPEKSVFTDQVVGESRFLILNRRASDENDNREKLKTVILHSWLDAEYFFKYPFLIYWDNGFHLLPRGEMGQDLRIYHHSKWEDYATDGPIPLGTGYSYQIGGFLISAGNEP